MEMKTQFSYIHFESAVALFEDAKRLEEQYENDSLEDRFSGIADARTTHDGYVVASIVSSISFLESVVNEFYDVLRSNAESWKTGEEPFLDLDSEEQVYNLIVGLQDVENRDFEKQNVLKKYQLILVYAGNEPYNRGEPPYQSVSTVRSVRNDLVHFEPDWHSSEETLNTPGNLPTSLDRNPFYEVENRDPESYLSADVTSWCISATGQFVIDFYQQMGMEDSIIVDNVRKSINKL